ncbi:hypothetical protein [Streptomyces luteireticuli]|uniref:hypothetical protein n=1 Tax=Streptomyces luteireticuli TaxID=173858 RepID=UPI003556CDAD
MTTRSIFIGAIKSIETVTRSFTFTALQHPRTFEIAVPEGGLILNGWAHMEATQPDGQHEPKSATHSYISPSGQAWQCEVEDAWRPSFPGFAWTCEVTLTVVYAVPA